MAHRWGYENVPILVDRGRSGGSERRCPRRTCHFVALVDDFSRYLLGIRAVATKEALPVLETLAEAIELCGIPHELMTDNGTPFVTIVRTMLSRFQRTLTELEIRHIRTKIDTPWTNGKIESFWATLQAEVLNRSIWPTSLSPMRPWSPTPATTTTIDSTARSTGKHRPSGLTGPRSPTAASSTCPRSRGSRTCWLGSSRHECHLPRGTSVIPRSAGS